MKLYGHEWPDDTPMATVHLLCYRNWQPNIGMLERHKHFEKAIRALWPENMANGKKGYLWSEWAYRRLWSWVYREYQTWWGPSSSGKSTDAGIFALTEWLSAPDRTTITVCSTTKDMLERRIWREIIRFHSLLGSRIPGVRFRQPPRIAYVSKEDGEGENTINAIFAVAVQKGTTAEAVGNMIGMHNDYNILIIDEMQATRQAAVEAYDNLSTGIGSKFLGMGNPVSRLDPLGRASEPKVGWGAISPANDEWETKRGWCLYFDGLKSPAIKHPKKFYFLLNQKQIDSMAKDPGRDSPRFWSQRRGFVPPEGLSETVFTESLVVKYQVREPAIWVQNKTRKFALDPAFSAGGDRAVLTPFDVGRFTSGVMGVEFLSPIYINLELTSGEPMSYAMSKKIISALEASGATPKDLAIDTTGAQRMLADIVDYEWKRKHPESRNDLCFRVGFSESASTLPVSPDDQTPCKDVYKTKVTELWFATREFARFGQLRGVCHEAVDQFCTREVLQVGRSIQIESKHDMKARTGGKSPDEADSVVIGIEYVRMFMNIPVGAGNSLLSESISVKDVIRNDIEVAGDLYGDDAMTWPEL